jgi:hypothetical protein
MKRYYFLMVLLVLVHSGLRAQTTDTIVQRIILIGDAGQLTNGRHPVVDAVKKNIPLDNKTVVLYLGDNLYKTGLPDVQNITYAAARAVLDSQVSVADGTPAKVYMIPGNHDWLNGGRDGYNAIIREQLYVDFLGNKNVKFYPEDGCPGPVEVPLGNDVVLILFDSQWWLHAHEKPEIESDCRCKTKDELVDQIADIAQRNSKKLVVVACHHPFKSNGIHGGYFTLKQHIFPLTDMKKNLYIPLPVIGSIYPLERNVFGTPQDISHPNYQNMIKSVTDAIKEASSNVVFVAGHDHNVQLIRDSGYHYIVSGGGCKQSRTSKNKNSLFNSTSQGFAVLEVSTNKSVTARFYTVEDTIGRSELFPLFNFSQLPAKVTDSIEHVAEDPFLKYKDTTSVPVTNTLKEVEGLRKYFMGQNYRAEWSAQVNMRVFNLRQEKGGFTIESLGGGKQTKSLRLRNNKTGQEWVLRGMNKNPTQTIPKTYRGSLAHDLVTELKSSSFPYGAFIVPGLAKAIGISTASPELFFVPDDPALGFYRPLFANTVCLLERRNASLDGTTTQSTAKIFAKLLEENDHRVIQADVLEARLLDILIADYDRHFDQWRWGSIDTGKGKIYYPVPRDRDQAFFYSDGRLIRFAAMRTMPYLKGFRSDIPKVEWLNYVARDFDRIFLTELDQKGWEKGIADVQQKLTDSAIRKSVQLLPPEIYALEGENIIKKLMSRRDVLKPAALRYYKFLSKRVNIVGSNQKEHFKVTSVGEFLRVRVSAKSKGNDTSFTMYDRVFDPKTTKEIRLFGLHDEDVFEIDEKAESRIKLRIIGGRGIDTFDLKGKVEALLYDLKSTGGDFYIKDSSHAKKRFSADPPVNDRTVLGFEYNTSKFPQFHFNYNSDDGMIIGAGFSRRTHGFRNLPYASEQTVSARYGIDRGALHAQYKGEFNHVTRNFDLVLNADFTSPSLNNFFGFGNRTEIDPALPRRYYQTLYTSFSAEALIRRRPFEMLHFAVGPYFYSYSAKYSRNAENVLGKASNLRLDSADVFSKKSYAGGKIVLTVDNRNQDFFPTRGMYWRNELIGLSGIKKGSDSYSAYVTDMSVYASFREPAKLIAILKFGGGRILSKNYEYFQAMSFGAQNDLPGFRKNRFAGRSSMYGGLEMRMQLFTINSYIIPGTFGLAGFYNVGKVWQPNDVITSGKWHDAYGIGAYYLPFNMFAISAFLGFHDGQKMLNFTLGSKINLTF